MSRTVEPGYINCLNQIFSLLSDFSQISDIGYLNSDIRFENKLAERTGLEPATSGVTGQHSNQLNYRSNKDRNIVLYIYFDLVKLKSVKIFDCVNFFLISLAGCLAYRQTSLLYS